ncbi:prolyl oligopeptidase family serine peptidase [Zunongwangia pacifica]|uniref:Prolyl oligopeptidase family serine peptidase n=1 Tax=Zunongwangia pacifica TaxID=2911062 RepID=A0A9X1ZYC7_9FLAO|nr:prolyl oligopeptidase family serine peptidase [Zunongwangia pacifica]MCL6218681.1 prolyl oligopeptidase family serine peptidase [Zunongwangia pacifica]
MRFFKNLFIACLVITTTKFSAQNREGNIVEYFGKEKVNDVSEGEVIHLFKKGLLLKTTGIPFSNASVEYDIVFADFLNETPGSEISEGKEVYDSFQEKSVKWEKISIVENGEFNNPFLRRNGYLYLEYTSEEEKAVLFEASGHTQVLINGLPHEGDHYDFGWNLIPITLKKGKNTFLLSGGRFPKIRARLLATYKPVEFTTRDLTLPDLISEGSESLWGAIRIINTQDKFFQKGSIQVKINGTSEAIEIPAIAPKYVRKVPFLIPNPTNLKEGESVTATLYLKDKNNVVIDTASISLDVKSTYKHHKNTFLSDIDHSVQYYSVAPSLTKDQYHQAMFLSVHGASVEAVNQANAYKQKDWGHVVAATNRRPFGFAWEDWGRLDALEVLKHASDLYKTNSQQTYLTGHSMGGHGTWYLGATYPDKFAAIAPAAGYPDLLEYRHSFTRNLNDAEAQQRFGMDLVDFEKKISPKFNNTNQEQLNEIIKRAGNTSRTLKLKENYLHFGVYILHGDSDNVVPTFLAREMRERLGKYHNDFAYYEYPGGEHWFGDESVDWPPIFYFFSRRKIKKDSEINNINFTTASPGVSKGSHFVSILQQEHPFEISNFKFQRTDTGFQLTTSNIKILSIDLKAMAQDTLSEVSIDGESIALPSSDKVYLSKASDEWGITSRPDASEKSPLRYGGFKDAFKNNMVFVYASKGSEEENEWYYNRAKFDAEKFWYRANGNIELVKDTDFKVSEYRDRNIILYGNRSNNTAWKKLLKHSPIQVSKDKMQVGEKTLKGSQYGTYFIYPKEDNPGTSIGVISATGIEGMHAAYANDYLENGTFFPDIVVFDDEMPKQGLSGVKFSGFFGNDWSIKNGDFIWNL